MLGGFRDDRIFLTFSYCCSRLNLDGVYGQIVSFQIIRHSVTKGNFIQCVSIISITNILKTVTISPPLSFDLIFG